MFPELGGSSVWAKNQFTVNTSGYPKNKNNEGNKYGYKNHQLLKLYLCSSCLVFMLFIFRLSSPFFLNLPEVV